eukprot:gene9639-12978_t
MILFVAMLFLITTSKQLTYRPVVSSATITNVNNKKQTGDRTRFQIQDTFPIRNIYRFLKSNRTRLRRINQPMRKVPFLRRLKFWTKATRIYSSYKVFQVKMAFSNIAYFSSKIFRHALNQSIPIHQDRNVTVANSWNHIHDINSVRMINLCLNLRGFYLKTGQFLGTRHDFMPNQYTEKLSTLHDQVPPMSADDIRIVLEEELCGPMSEYFTELNLQVPIGSASVAQVHKGVWKKTGQQVAVKIQYPHAEKLMTSDLKNIRALAEFLQKTELKFDILSAIKELQKQIANEFDFRREAANMEFIRSKLIKTVPEVKLPTPIHCTKRLLVMTYIDGDNLSKLAEFKDKGLLLMPLFIKQRFGRNLLKTLAKAWGEQIFVLKTFNADPHPGNICIDKKLGVGLLDWGQVKTISDETLLKFSYMVESLNSRNSEFIVDSFNRIGVRVGGDLTDKDAIASIATSMLDTRKIPGFIMDPFNAKSFLKRYPVTHMPSDLYFIIRTVQLMRGITFAFGLDYSLAESWGPYARKVIQKHSKK